VTGVQTCALPISVGRNLRVAGSAPARATVVGVVRDPMASRALADILPMAPIFVGDADRSRAMGALLVRAEGDPRALIGPVRDAVRQVDRSQAAAETTLVEDMLTGQSSQAWMLIGLMNLFAAVALALAAVGVFGVTSYSVAERTREFGLRIAMGATSGDILRMVTGQALRVVATGVVLAAAGTPSCAAAARSTSPSCRVSRARWRRCRASAMASGVTAARPLARGPGRTPSNARPDPAARRPESPVARGRGRRTRSMSKAMSMIWFWTLPSAARTITATSMSESATASPRALDPEQAQVHEVRPEGRPRPPAELRQRRPILLADRDRVHNLVPAAVVVLWHRPERGE